MSWKDTVNGALRKTGYELRRAGSAPPAAKVAKPSLKKTVAKNGHARHAR